MEKRHRKLIAFIALGGADGERIVTVQECGGLRDLATRRVVLAP